MGVALGGKVDLVDAVRSVFPVTLVAGLREGRTRHADGEHRDEEADESGKVLGHDCTTSPCLTILAKSATLGAKITKATRRLGVVHPAASRCGEVVIHLPRAEKSDDFREVVDAAMAQGWAVEQTRKGHWRFKPPDGGDMVVFSGSPGD